MQSLVALGDKMLSPHGLSSLTSEVSPNLVNPTTAQILP